MSVYDKHYKTENLFGSPYPELIEFFSSLSFRGKVLDLGCGQGRNAIPIARMGHTVTGIDVSKVGLEQMMQSVKNSNLLIKGLVADIYSMDSFVGYDIILLDSMFHFYKRDLEKETSLLEKIALTMDNGAIICVFINDKGKKVKTLKNVLNIETIKWDILSDRSLIYHDTVSGRPSEMPYRHYALRKR